MCVIYDFEALCLAGLICVLSGFMDTALVNPALI